MLNILDIFYLFCSVFHIWYRIPWKIRCKCIWNVHTSKSVNTTTNADLPPLFFTLRKNKVKRLDHTKNTPIQLYMERRTVIISVQIKALKIFKSWNIIKQHRVIAEPVLEFQVVLSNSSISLTAWQITACVARGKHFAYNPQLSASDSLALYVGLCIAKTSTLNHVVIKTIWTQQQKLPVQDVLILSAQLKPHYLTNNCYFLKPLQNATLLNWKTETLSLTLFLEDLCYKEVFCSSFSKATESNHNMCSMWNFSLPSQS